jgi:hypothetical protein
MLHKPEGPGLGMELKIDDVQKHLLCHHTPAMRKPV